MRTKDDLTHFLQLFVKPSSSTIYLEDYGEELKLQVTSPPTKGKANKEISDFFSDLLSLQNNQIEIVKGHTSSTKIVAFYGIERKAIVDEITKVLQAQKMQ